MEQLSLSASRPVLRMQSDERLAALAAAGHERAFEAIVQRYRRSLLRACQRVLTTGGEDAVQEALVSAHRALVRNGPPERLRPWLHRIAVNAAITEATHQPDLLPIEESRLAAEPADELHARRERLHGTVAAIGMLPLSQRRALVLRELEGRSHEEIARELGLTGGAVRQLIHRARNGVRSAASAITPSPLLASALTQPGGTGPSATELAAAGAGGGLAAKAAVAAVVVGGASGGALIGGADLTPGDRNDGPPVAQAAAGDREPASSPASTGREPSVAAGAGQGDGDGDSHSATSGSDHGGGPDGGEHGHDGEGGDGAGVREAGDDGGSGHSGESSSSGPGSSSSGSGHSGSGHSESGPSGSGTSDDSSGPGSPSSGPGSSGSANESSGSGSSGSGSSGSGSSGSDSGSSGSSEHGDLGSGEDQSGSEGSDSSS